MAFVSLKFLDVFASQGNAIAEEAIRRIVELYAVEKEARAKPIFDDLEAWRHAQLPEILGKSPLAQAILYALGRMPKARGLLHNGHLELDNKSVERTVKPVAIGRKT